jgi:tetratricopeptide (TPR) repeat protein
MKKPLKTRLCPSFSLLLSLFLAPSILLAKEPQTKPADTDPTQTVEKDDASENKPITIKSMIGVFSTLAEKKGGTKKEVAEFENAFASYNESYKPPKNPTPGKSEEEIRNNSFVREHPEKLVNVINVLGDGEETDGARKMAAQVFTQSGNEQNTDGYRHAAEIIEPTYRRRRNDPNVLRVRAEANLGLGNHTVAIEDTTRAVEVDNQDERAYMIRALAYYQMKNYPKALEDSKRALALNPNNMTAYQIAKLSKGKVTTADEMNLTAIQKAMQEEVRREYESSEQQRRQFESASKTISPKTLQARAPTSGERMVDSLNLKARSAINLGDPRGAIKLTNQALHHAPENPDVLYTRAAAENLMGQYENAVEDATAALHRKPDHYQALDARALALVNLERPHEAIADADRSIAINPDSPYAYTNRAKAKENLGDYAGMIADYREASRLSSQFEDDLKEAAQKYGINLEPKTLRAMSPKTDITLEQSAAKGSQKKRFAVILISAVTGGLLIAFGLVHIIMGPRGNKKRITLGTAGTRSDADRLAGTALEEGYKVLREVGHGGMGIVYEAVDKALDRKVAIKKMRDEIHDDPRERERFLSEARIVAGLHHPNIVDIHNVFDDEGELFMVFEYVEGSTIDQVLAKKGKLSISEAQFIVHGVTAALSYAHTKGVIHRDLKPSNIMITKDGMVKVMDFGIARQAQDAMAASTKTNTVAGTPHYMAPEQEQGIVRKESDIFALGACLYEMLTGERPYPAPATTESKINKRYEKPSRVAANLPLELDEFIDAALEPDPDKRIRTASEFRTRLDDINSTNELLS